MMKKNKKTSVYIEIGLIFILAIAVAVKVLNAPKTTDISIDDINEVLIEEASADPVLFTKKEFDDFYAINQDYIGQIIFESGIINEPIVYSNIGSYYLRKNINKDYSIQGTVYLDERNSLDDQNLILYGHFTEPDFTDYEGYDPDIRPMFTNLDLLLDQDNYEDNQTVYLFLENEIRKYEVVCVYYCPLLMVKETNDYGHVSEGYEYYLTEYSFADFDKYKNNILENQRYSTGKDFGINDELLTLQTCVAERPDLREIVLCKEISRNSYY